MSLNKENKTVTTFEETDDLSMEDLMREQDKHEAGISVGKELEVTILAQTDDGFLVDIGIKSEGLIPKSEYAEGPMPEALKIGNKIKAKIVSMKGQPILSYKALAEKVKWDALEKLVQEGKHVHGTIAKTIKGGFLVDVGGINAFLHISQVDTSFVKDGEKYVGKSYEFAVTEFDRRAGKISVSRRKLLEDQKAAKRESVLGTLAQGQIIDGTVSKITNFGAFVDLGGVDGLLHISDIAWYKVRKVEDLLHEGQTVRVQVQKIDPSGKISLNMKSLTTQPWESAESKFPVGLIMKGKVTSVADYGAFVELEPGIEGLLHTSEYSYNDSEAEFRKNVKKGQEIEVKIIAVDTENKKISLSVKKMQSNPWDDVVRHYVPGTVIKGKVENIMPFGAFVKLPEGIEGLVHISDFSWTKKVKNPEEMVKKGDEIEVMVLNVSPQTEKISLSIKHVQGDPYKKYKVGTVVTGKVLRVAEFGAFVELEPGIEALIKNNEASSVKAERDQSVLKEGEEVEAKIIKVDAKDRKIEASVKKLEFDREKELVKKFANQDDKPKLGDMLTEEE